MLNHAKLWILLDERKMKRTDLTKNKVISTATLAKLGKNEPISSTVIEKLCDYLECQPGDIMENVTRKDYNKLNDTVNDFVNEIMEKLTSSTGMSRETIIDMMSESLKSEPEILKSIKGEKADLLGINEHFRESTPEDEE